MIRDHHLNRQRRRPSTTASWISVCTSLCYHGNDTHKNRFRGLAHPTNYWVPMQKSSPNQHYNLFDSEHKRRRGKRRRGRRSSSSCCLKKIRFEEGNRKLNTSGGQVADSVAACLCLTWTWVLSSMRMPKTGPDRQVDGDVKLLQISI